MSPLQEKAIRQGVTRASIHLETAKRFEEQRDWVMFERSIREANAGLADALRVVVEANDAKD